ncbi:MAG: ABC transporter permease [Xanthomonadaceae bacterium]|nr:ABC transporter permease [Xanthomonadaceae bacterium]
MAASTTKKLFGELSFIAGDFTLFVGESLRTLRRLSKRSNLFFKQCEAIGVTSTMVVLMAAGFIGAVMGYQLYTAFHRFGAEALVGGSVGVALFRELAPIMTAIMVSGRAGAAMTAEIATMRVTEQIDALEVMGVNPVEYLVMPRVAAGLVMTPLLGIMFGVAATLAAAGLCSGVLDLSLPMFWAQFRKWVDAEDVLLHCGVKSAVFGLVLTWIACYCGFNAKGGAGSVGRATQTTVVTTFLAVLFCDYILTTLLPYGWAILTLM